MKTTGFKVKSCKSLVVFHALSRNFYYRCTPYVYEAATNSGYFRGAAGYDARQFSWTDILNPVGVIKMLNDVMQVLTLQKEVIELISYHQRQ